MIKSFIIAIDGEAACGKTTLTKSLACKLNFEFLLTGNLYRALAKKVYSNNLQSTSDIVLAASKITTDNLDDDSLNNENLAKIASHIATIAEVREQLNQLQRDFAYQNHKGIIIEGRDIGTVIFPEADIKLFLTASLEIRAKRRYNELLNRGNKVIYDHVLAKMAERDINDRSRLVSPLVSALDAITIDTTNLSEEDMLHKALRLVNAKT